MRLQFEPFDGSDDEAAEAATVELVDRFERWVATQPGRLAGDVDASDVTLLLGWKYRYADGDLGRWTRADVDEVLLEHLPRKLSASPAAAATIPVTLAAFVRFLADTGLCGEAAIRPTPSPIEPWPSSARSSM